MAATPDNSVTSVSSTHYDVFDDPLFLCNSDQPTLQIAGFLFDGKNFVHWKREVYLALVSKNKEGFIDGSVKMPAKTDRSYHQWVRCDLMVMRWIKNSVVKEIKDTLGYARTSKDLWTELLDRYGQTNGVEIYQLKKELGEIQQAGDSVVEYYSKLKRKWEDLDSVDPFPSCTCGAMELCTCQLLKRILTRESQEKLIRFLMGLNNIYEGVRTNVLSMEPLPPINKAFALLSKVELQKQISDAADVLAEANAFVCTKDSDHSLQGGKKPRLDSTSENNVKTCNYCHHLGHTKDECFKLKECSYCGRNGHARNNCWQLQKSQNNRSARGRGRGRFAQRDSYHTVTHKTAHNAEAYDPYDAEEEFSPLDMPHDTTNHVSGQESMNKGGVNDLVDTVMQKVLQALSDKSNSSLCTSNFAGPFK